MVDQATVRPGKPGEGNTDGKNNSNGSPQGRLVGGIAEFGNDIATLAELQYKLGIYDFNEAIGKALIPLALMVVGALFILGALPVLLFGLADLIASALQIKMGWALLLTSLTTIILAGAVLTICALRIPNALSSFRRSREELQRNLSWVRTVLVHSGRSMPRRFR